MPDDLHLAVVTGASTGIGLGIARALADRGCDLIVAADEPQVTEVAAELRATGVRADPLEVDLATRTGVEELAAAVRTTGRPLDVMALNAGIGVEGPFVETDIDDHIRLIELNVTGAVHLAGLLLPAMVARGAGRVLVTSSIADTMTGPRMSTYNASKTFLTAWAEAVAQELDDTGVTMTILKPGGTDTQFFARADMEASALARRDNDDADAVGREAVDAAVAGRAEIVSGPVRNRLLHAAARLVPDPLIGAAHARAVDSDGDAPDR